MLDIPYYVNFKQIGLTLPHETETSGAFKKYRVQIVLQEICVGYKNTAKIVEKISEEWLGKACERNMSPVDDICFSRRSLGIS